MTLHELRHTCNKLPLSLAQDERGQGGKHGRPTELARVYVNLETDAAPTLAEIFRRLGIAEQEWPQLTAAMQLSRTRERWTGCSGRGDGRRH